MPELLAKPPSDVSDIEIAAFIALVGAGGEVPTQALSKRILSAMALVFARVDELVVGVAALKQPQASYRRHVSLESGASISADEFPYELGWVYVSPESRGKGFSLMLSQAALAESKGSGVFATSRTDNAAMHRSLAKLGFAETGYPFASARGMYSLQTFARPAAQHCAPRGAPR